MMDDPPTPADPPAAPPPRRRRRWLRRAVLGLTLLALILLIGLPPLVGWAGRALLLDLLTRELDGRVRLGEITMRWPASVELTDVQLDDPDGRRILTAPRIAVDLSLSRLLRGVVEGEVRIERPSVTLRHDANRGWNVGRLLEKPRALTEPGDPEAEPDARPDGDRAARPGPRLPDIGAWVRISGGRLTLIGPDGVARDATEIDVTVRAAALDEPILVDLSLASGGGRLRVSGHTRLGRDGRWLGRAVSARAQLALTALPLAPIGVFGFDGDVLAAPLSGRVDARMPRWPEAHGTARLRFAGPIVGLPTGSDLDLRLAPRAAGRTPLALTVANPRIGRLTLTGSLLGWRGVDAELDAALAPPDGVGGVSGSARLAGQTTLRWHRHVRGRLTASGAVDGIEAPGRRARWSWPGPLCLSLAAGLDGATARLERLSLSGGPVSLTGQARLQLRSGLPGEARCDLRLDLTRLAALASTALDQALDAAGTARWQAAAMRSASGLSLDGQLTLTGARARVGQHWNAPLDGQLLHRTQAGLDGPSRSRVTLRSPVLALRAGALHDLAALRGPLQLTGELRPGALSRCVAAWLDGASLTGPALPFALRLEPTRAAPRLTVDLSGRRLRLTAAGRTLSLARLTARLDGPADAPTLTHLTVAGPGFELTANDVGARRLGVRGQLDPAALPWLDGAPSGPLTVAGALHWGAGQRLEARLRGPRLAWGTMTLTAPDVRLSVARTAGHAPWTLRADGGAREIRLAAEAELGAQRARIDATWSSRVASLFAALPAGWHGPPEGTLAGRLRLSRNGRLWRIDSQSRLTNLVLRAGTPARLLREARSDLYASLVYDAHARQLRILDARLDGATLAGAITGGVDLRGAEPRLVGLHLDLTYRAAGLDVLLAPWLPGRLRARRPQRLAVRLDGPPGPGLLGALRRLTATASVDVGDWSHNGLTVAGRLAGGLGSGRLSARGRLEASGGTADVEAALDLRPAALESTLVVALDEAQAHAQMGGWLSRVNPILNVRKTGRIGGRFDLTLRLRYPGPLPGTGPAAPRSLDLARLRGAGRLSTRQIEVLDSPLLSSLVALLDLGGAATRIQILPFAFHIADGRLTYDEPLQMRIGVIETRWTGSVGLTDGALQLTMEIPISGGLLSRFPGLRHLPEPRLRIPVRGTSGTPTLVLEGLRENLTPVVRLPVDTLSGLGRMGLALGSMLGLSRSPEVRAAELLRKADALHDRGASAEAAALYRRLRTDHARSTVYRRHRRRIEARADRRR